MVKKSKKRKTAKKKFKAEGSQKELVIKTKSDWVKKGLVNKKTYEKKYTDSIKNNDSFWKKDCYLPLFYQIIQIGTAGWLADQGMGKLFMIRKKRKLDSIF